MYKILYVQNNEKIARLFMDEFLSSEYQLLVAHSGEEALSVMAETDILLLLVDINIPDMRLRRLISKAKDITPGIIVNVCIDVCDCNLIPKLVNRYGVHKIYVAPWNISEIIYEIGDSIEVALINEESHIKESKLIKERKSLDETIVNLRSALQKQQYSYDKIKTLTDCLFEGVKNINGDEINEKRHEFLVEIFDKYLKLATTGSFNIEELEDCIKADLNEIRFNYPGFKYGKVISCFFGGVRRLDAINCRFAVWLISKLYAEFYSDAGIDITSHFVTTTEAKFTCRVITPGGSLPPENSDEEHKCASFVNEVLDIMVNGINIEKKADSCTYEFTVKVKDE